MRMPLAGEIAQLTFDVLLFDAIVLAVIVRAHVTEAQRKPEAITGKRHPAARFPQPETAGGYADIRAARTRLRGLGDDIDGAT